MFRKNAFSTILAISALLAMTFAILLISTPANAGPSKVEVCHIPPDDPENFHTITVNQNALPAHIAHYDLGGACDGACAALCDDGDRCTYEDTGDCESTGCPVPEPVVCGPGQVCDPEVGCISVESECPCAAFANLEQFGGTPICSASPVGILFEGGLVCVGGICSSGFVQSGCVASSFDGQVLQVEPFDIGSDEEQACVSVVETYCSGSGVQSDSGALLRDLMGSD